MSELLKKHNRTKGEELLIQNYNFNKDSIKYLPITPDKGIIEFLTNNFQMRKEIECKLNATIKIKDIMDSDKYNQYTNDTDGIKKDGV